jgi:hypothetical protein
MLARHRDPRIVPLELWDLIVDGAPLYRAERDRSFGATLARGVETLCSGAAASESGARFPDACRTIRRVVLAGGAAAELAWTSARIPAFEAPDGEFCGERGGLSILARAGARGLVVDLGQSRLKVSSGAARRVYPRDLEAIPVSGRPVDGTGREALVAFVAGALLEASAGLRPEALVLALPCEISPEGVLGTCTYPWTPGDSIVTEILARAGLGEVPGFLLNDAELAAVGVAAREPAAGTTLVLTLGFGVGGALVLGDA